MNSGLTAIARTKPSRPMRDFCDFMLTDVPDPDSWLDFGCGKGTDVQYLNQLGFNATGYDPNHNQFSNPCVLASKYDVVSSIYVLNVIEFEKDRVDFWDTVAECASRNGHVYVASRTPKEIASSLGVSEKIARQGAVTSRRTYQRGWTHGDLEHYGSKRGLLSVGLFGTPSTYAGVLFRS
jgi:hypothetical protein